MAKYGIDSYENFINKFLKISQSKPVSFEVCSDELNEMYEQAKELILMEIIFLLKFHITIQQELKPLR